MESSKDHLERKGWIKQTRVDDLLKAVDEQRRLVCFCTGESCFRCKQVQPKVAGFPEDYPELVFCFIDLELAKDADLLSDVYTLPQFLLYRDGQRVATFSLPQKRPARAVSQAIKAHLFGQHDARVAQ